MARNQLRLESIESMNERLAVEIQSKLRNNIDHLMNDTEDDPMKIELEGHKKTASEFKQKHGES